MDRTFDLDRETDPGPDVQGRQVAGDKFAAAAVQFGQCVLPCAFAGPSARGEGHVGLWIGVTGYAVLGHGRLVSSAVTAVEN
jgi:hypothetical protein